MKIITCNCNSASFREFLRSSKEMIRKFLLNVLGLVETRISEEDADKVCRSLGFDEWIRVEAVGFSGGI